MSPFKKLRVLILVHEGLVPPIGAKVSDAKEADWKTEFDVQQGLQKLGHEVKVLGLGSELTPIRSAIFTFKPHIVFNLMEAFGDIATFDQNVVSYLELLGVPYTGCNPRGLLISKDKALCKKILHYHRIPNPKFAVFPRNRRVKISAKLEFPLIVKSLTEEASLGISQSSVVHDRQKLIERIQFIHDSIYTDAIAETFIPGRELYVGVLGNFRTEVFPIWELIFRNTPEQKNRIATQRVKWDANYRKKYGITSREARDIDETQREAIHALCKRIYKVLGLSGYARFDFRLSQDGKIYLIEANPNPQIAHGEDFAESAALVGISYPELLQKILNLGLRWTPGASNRLSG